MNWDEFQSQIDAREQAIKDGLAARKAAQERGLAERNARLGIQEPPKVELGVGNQGLEQDSVTIEEPEVGGSGVPEGTTMNDLLYWDSENEEWKVLAAPSTSGVWVLTVTAGVIGWTEAENCEVA